MSYLEELDLEEEGLTKEEIKKRKTKIFVGGLKYSSKDDVLKEYFSQFGEIEEAVVIYDRESGLSKGYGFVTMSTDEGAELAIKDKSPRLDGRRCNVNLAYIGQKKKNGTIMGKGKTALTIQGAQLYQTSPTYLQNGYQQKLLANGQAYYSPTSTQLRYPMYGQIGVPYLNQCQHTYYAIPGSSPTYDQRDGTYMQPYVLTQQFVVAGNNTNGYTSPTAVNGNNNNNNSSVPNYNQVAFIGQYPVLMETSANPIGGQVTTTTPTYASSPGPTSCAANGNGQVFHFHQQEIVNQ